MVDIDRLTEKELIDLNHRIVERLRFMSQMRAHKRMLSRWGQVRISEPCSDGWFPSVIKPRQFASISRRRISIG